MAIRNIKWIDFEKKNDNTTEAFEKMCTHLFCRKYNLSSGDVSQAYNQPGVEIFPITIGSEIIGFQSKYCGDTTKFYSEAKKSLEIAFDKYPNLTKIILYTQLKIGVVNSIETGKNSARKAIEKICKNANCEIEIFANVQFELALSENPDIYDYYFSDERIDKLFNDSVSIEDRTFLDSDEYRRSTYNCGYITFSKIKLKDLHGEEGLLPPNVYMNVPGESYNKIVSLYTRDLGMILNYEESWINAKEFSISADDDEVLVTLFVPDTSADITAGDKTVNLGEYLRQREEADHMKWDDDPASMKVKCVKNIKKTVDDSVRKYYNPEQIESHAESDVSEFADALGERLFPRKKTKPKEGGGNSGSGGGVSRNEKKYCFSTKGITITQEGRLKVSCDLELKDTARVIIKTKISSDVTVDAAEWNEKIGTVYPLRVTNFVIEVKENDSEVSIEEKNCEVVIGGEKNKISASFEIEASDKKLAFVIDCEEKKEEDNQ